MKTKLPGDVLREFLGHRSVEMTDQYDNPILLERLKAFQDMRSAVERFWDKKTGQRKSPNSSRKKATSLTLFNSKSPRNVNKNKPCIHYIYTAKPCQAGRST
jgi:hypothetical protein